MAFQNGQVGMAWLIRAWQHRVCGLRLSIKAHSLQPDNPGLLMLPAGASYQVAAGLINGHAILATHSCWLLGFSCQGGCACGERLAQANRPST